jgi:hypothetical protein
MEDSLGQGSFKVYLQLQNFIKKMLARVEIGPLVGAAMKHRKISCVIIPHKAIRGLVTQLYGHCGPCMPPL